MGKYFGTDGIRGVANLELRPELVFKLGRAVGYLILKEKREAKVLIGRDTRISGELLEKALVAGLLSVGIDVILVGIISTPGVAYLTRTENVGAGIMISASHNPVEDNGIKIFAHDGYKLTDSEEEEIEALLEAKEDLLPRPIGEQVGRVKDDQNLIDKYRNFLKKTTSYPFAGLKIVIDAANGSASRIAPQIFSELGGEIIAINNEPNGININVQCGSTHPAGLQKKVVELKADLGLAFDGDADRLIAVDHTGQLVDGDKIMYLLSKFLSEQKRLKKNTLVTTVMSNLGLHKALEKIGINTIQTKVGDRYVMDEMRANNFNIGGEQSGHIILLDYNTTGDGILSAVQLVNVMRHYGKTLDELTKEIEIYPQILVNVRVKDKAGWEENKKIQQAIKEVEDKLNGEGRLLVRASGTEPLLRIMAEGKDKYLIENYTNYLADIVKNELS